MGRYLLSRVVCLSVCLCPCVYTFHFITVSPCNFYFHEYKKKKKKKKKKIDRTISIKNRISISCNSCFNSLQTEDICFVLQLTVCSDIQTSLNSIFISECLQGENAPFCHLCASKQDAESQLSICEVGCYVIVQLKRFFMIYGVATKNAAPVVCSPYVSVPVRVDDEVTGTRKFALVSGICHSGTLTPGHYSAFVRDNVCGIWLHCLNCSFIMAYAMLTTFITMTRLLLEQL